MESRKIGPYLSTSKPPKIYILERFTNVQFSSSSGPNRVLVTERLFLQEHRPETS